jgi:hypothetical protein
MDEKTPDTTTEMKANLGKPTAIVFSFDTTGSMQPCIQQVRQKLRDLVEMMRQDIPDLRIGLISHGDYCDGPNAIHVLDLTTDLEKIMQFINETPNTGGGDAPECYELALNRANSMSWPAEGGSLVLIGDDEPHDPNYPQNTDHLDWREEVKALKAKKVNVFPLQCLQADYKKGANLFWEQVSGEAGTPLLILENFKDSASTLEAAAYAAGSAATGDAALYKGYLGKYAAAPACAFDGESVGSAENLCSNRGKLDAWTETNTTTDSSKTE